MTINFYLRSYKTEKSPIRVQVAHRGKVHSKSIGISVPVKQWSQSKQRCADAKVNDRIREIRRYLEDTIGQSSTADEIDLAIARVLMTDDDIKAVGEPELTDYPATLYGFWQSWADRDVASKRQRRSNYRQVRSLFPNLDWQGIDSAFYVKLCRRMDEKGWSRNYQGAIIHSIKAVCNEAYNLGINGKADFRSFKRISEKTDKIYLTEREMAAVEGFDSERRMLRKARDLALLGYLTCSRYSDYSRLSTDNISNGRIRFAQRKTGDAVIIPCSPKVLAILERWGGRAPSISQQKFNDSIKEVCRLVGIDTPVEVVRSEGTRQVHSVVPKWSLVGSHTFRRSAATNLYLGGVPLRSIMQLTGHSSVAMLETYLRVGRDENANILADNPFFK